MSDNDNSRVRYPPGIQILQSRWHDPHGSMGMNQGPVIEVRVYADPNMYEPARLKRQLEWALVEVSRLLRDMYGDSYQRFSRGQA